MSNSRSRNMTPPPRYRRTMPSSYHSRPPSYDALFPMTVNEPSSPTTSSISSSFVEGTPIQPPRQTLWVRLLLAVSALIFYMGAFLIFAWRFNAYIVYAQRHEDLVTDALDLLALALTTMACFASLIFWGIYDKLNQIMAMMTEPGEISEEEQPLAQV